MIGIRPNHTMAKIVNVYLRLNPSLDRPQLEKETCDLVNVINGSIVSFGVLVMVPWIVCSLGGRTFQAMGRPGLWLFVIVDI